MAKSNFYCQKICGEEGFSIDEWNNTAKALELTNLSEREKQDILFPPQCEVQCFDCLAIVGKTREHTQQLVQKLKSN